MRDIIDIEGFHREKERERAISREVEEGRWREVCRHLERD